MSDDHTDGAERCLSVWFSYITNRAEIRLTEMRKWQGQIFSRGAGAGSHDAAGQRKRISCYN